MDSVKRIEDEDGEEEGIKHESFFVEDSCSSEEQEGEIKLNQQKHDNKRAARLSRGRSPPLLLAFSITSGRDKQEDNSTDCSPSSTLDLKEQEDEDWDQPIEEWMILGEEEQEGDSCIQLNLSCWSSSDEDDSGDEDPNVKAQDTWAVSDKDKGCADTSLPCRYYAFGHSLICHICNRTGHQAKSCPIYKKCPTCVLCGVRGHNQRECLSRPCPRCGRPSHSLRPCEKPPVWNQHCQRCGMTGHLSDTCPDTWRQYHQTIRLEVPLRLQPVQTSIRKKRPAHCYNCSKRGHYGYECTKRRMVSGTFPSLPYVYHYDSMEEFLQLNTRMQNRATEHVCAGSLPFPEQQHMSEPLRDSGEENQLVQRSRMKQDPHGRACRRKTWPERRRERQEVKRLRREAQARREGGGLGQPRCNSDDESSYADPFRSNGQKRSASPPKKKRKEGAGGQSRKSREAERWKKRRGMKRGDLHPYGGLDIGSENLLSPKQRVRHRRR
ncbi:zinc finger CCHC domain-containing protein 7-like isoform X2 [Sphaeramia orbicularis]|uniref:Zinc finger CCHC domain-containing protein 7 n=1 Tax=Sphaeramia orbicularis TaxID=375764 RepID=A0A672ZKA1_9TELE|nr:zinc finger CCHC domain-containing protein 7-like isoform X2 [Sphaeramia orbicularis]